MKKEHVIALTVLAALFIGIGLALIGSCDRTADKPENVVSAIKPVEPRDHGNGIYYFPVLGEVFAKSLSTFIAKHPDLEPKSITPSISSGTAIGYVVIFRQKDQKK